MIVYDCFLLFYIFSSIIKVAGDTLGSSLCIYLKRMHEVQRLTSTALRDIHDWIKIWVRARDFFKKINSCFFDILTNLKQQLAFYVYINCRKSMS